ncbi:neuferricin [Anoplophora glabripennis]|uniref:neuferricin n=1 Tax=Anoplophora glabripennis TaxID=217634 RepID=UPI0008741752|nr:neuferricin [Anoplophora glabripennis]
MFKKLVIVSLIAVTVDFFCGEKATDIILSLYKTVFYSTQIPVNRERVFTKEELKLYNGVDKPQLYLAILGNVFDVSKGIKHYGPNKQYNVFVGQDASRSFVTGKFNKEDISEDVADFSYEELRSLDHWLNFYKKEYTKIGLLNGKYFDEYGRATPYGEAVQNLIKEAEQAKQQIQLEKTKFPPCNVEWDADKGSRVWCSQKSGGIERSWVGVPRQLYEPGSKSYRCACINESNEDLGVVKEYEGCDKTSFSCFVTQN